MGLRLLWNSNAAFAASGYGQQTLINCKRIQKMPEVEQLLISAFYGVHGGIIEYEKLIHLPPGTGDWGNNDLQLHSYHTRSDAAICLQDIWPLRKDIAQIGFLFCLPYDEIIWTDRGYIKIGDIVTQRLPVQVISEKDGKPVWSEIEEYQTIPSQYSDKVYDLTLESGVSLHLTGDNPVMTSNGWIKTKDIKIGMEIRVAKRNRKIADQTSIYSGSERNNPISPSDGFGIFSRFSRCGWINNSQTANGENAFNSFDGILQRQSSSFELDLQPFNGEREGNFGSCLSNKRIPLSSISRSPVTIFDSKERTSRYNHFLYKFPHRERNETIQQPFYQRAIQFIHSNERIEFSFERCSKISVSKRQPPVVFDIKTSEGNFVANGILVHNCPWFPVDHEPLPEMIYSIANTAYMPITMSKFAFNMCEARNMKNLKYVPHSVETKIYKPHSNAKNREEREKLGLPKDAFVVGIVAANKGWPARKAWPQMFEALARFCGDHDDVYVYCHTLLTPEDQGIDIVNVIRSFGLGDRVILPNPYLYLQGFPQEEMSRIYSCFDVFLLTSMGEGFGVPIIEAQAYGTPVIVTDFTAMPELVGAGHLVKAGYKWYTPLFSYQVLPDIDDIVEKLELQYNTSATVRKEQGKKARQFIVDNYDTDDVVNKYWRPIIQELAEVTERKGLRNN